MKSHTTHTNMDDSSSQPPEPNTPSTPGPSTESRPESGHKRIPSGGLSKLAILRASAENNVIQADVPLSPEQTKAELTPRKAARAMAAVVQQQKTRRRKGSLRKAALLGRGAQREKSQIDASPLIAQSSQPFGSDGVLSPTSPDEQAQQGWPATGNMPVRPERPRYPVMGSYTSTRASPSAAPSTGRSSFSLAGQILSPQPQRPAANPNTLKPSPPLSYTTSDDEPLSFASRKPPSPAASSSVSQTSYFGNHLPSSLFQKRSRSTIPSPLSHPSNSPTQSDDTWDYSTTSLYGWLILLTTWLVFIVGMGSCLDVWSWAWDVGETPYAPPELEDDPTLPITGYYPALMVLTAVVSWVWCTCSWVGMKYFRHARISD